MKIGFDAKRAFNNTAGLGNFSRNTITALASQNPNDKLFLFHPGGNRVAFNIPENSIEIKPVSFLWKSLNNAWRSFLISKLVKQQKLDIYHGLTHELPVGIENTGVKSVVTIHDLIYIRYPEFFSKIDCAIYDAKFRYACRVATQIHAISEQTKRDLMHYFFIPEGRIKVIYQSVNPVFYERIDEAQKHQLRLKYQLPPQFILSVGTIEPRKNLMALLEGMVMSKIYIPLVVVGKMTEYQYKVQKFIEADLNRLQVLFLTKINDAELSVLYQMAEVLAYPSVFEGFGLPVAEAQASGCPVITSNISSLPEAGGDAAMYINPESPAEIGSALETLLADNELRESLIVKGKANAERFRPKNFASQLKQLYNSLLND